jgi:uncharacterized tellurite resistance protein B-like protein
LAGIVFRPIEILHQKPMNYNLIITRLYYLLIYADGNVNQKEISSAKHMIKAEGINESQFNTELESSKGKDHEQMLAECIAGLKKLDNSQQIRIVAWLCVLANADGFMDRSEWQLIYRIYHKELSLPLNEIFSVQKELNRVIWIPGSEIANQKTV